MLGKRYPVEGAIAETDRLHLGREPRDRRLFRRQVHERLADGLAIIRKLFGGPGIARIPDRLPRWAGRLVDCARAIFHRVRSEAKLVQYQPSAGFWPVLLCAGGSNCRYRSKSCPFSTTEPTDVDLRSRPRCLAYRRG